MVSHSCIIIDCVIIRSDGHGKILARSNHAAANSVQEPRQSTLALGRSLSATSLQSGDGDVHPLDRQKKRETCQVFFLRSGIFQAFAFEWGQKDFPFYTSLAFPPRLESFRKLFL